MGPLQILSLAVLFLASSTTLAQSAAVEEVLLDVKEGAPLTVNCPLRVEQRAEWKLGGGKVPGDMRAGESTAAGGGVRALLTAPAARRHHAGVYTCSRDPLQKIRVRVSATHAPPSGVDSSTGPAPTPAQTENVAAAKSEITIPLSLFIYDVGRSFSLNCTPPSLPSGAKIQWSKNGTEVDKVTDLRDRYTIDANGEFRLTTRSNEDDFGNYTCSVGDFRDIFGWQVQAKPYAKLPSDANVVEGQKLKLVCRLIGKPYPAVEWTYRNSSATNGSDVVAALGERVRLAKSEQGVEGAELTIDPARREDAGEYTCTPAIGGLHSTTTLRVKDMYAALWPFLGICAEVFVLCAIILLYEKRRTKPDLDDSDTDNHDQKKS